MDKEKLICHIERMAASTFPNCFARPNFCEALENAFKLYFVKTDGEKDIDRRVIASYLAIRGIFNRDPYNYKQYPEIHTLIYRIDGILMSFGDDELLENMDRIGGFPSFEEEDEMDAFDEEIEKELAQYDAETRDKYFDY